MVERKIEINIQILKEAINSIISSIEEEGEIILIKDKSYYWDVSEEERYAFEKSPENFLVGDLYEDWEMISKIHNDPESLEFSTADIPHLIALLRAVQEALFDEMPDVAD